MGNMIKLPLLVLFLINVEILLSLPYNNQNNRINKPNFDHQKNCDISASHSSTFLWSINTWPTSFLFGTIHVPFTQVWPQVSLAVRESFRTADKVFFELDLTNEGNHRELFYCQILPHNETVANYLDEETIQDISKLFWKYRTEKLRSLPHKKQFNFKSKFDNLTRNWKSKRPFWLLIILSDLMKTPNNEIAVLDLYLAQEARKMGKEIGSIENVQDQCGPINSIPNSYVAKWIRKTLDSIQLKSFNQANKDEHLDHLIRLYNCGDPSIVYHTENKLPRISIDEITAGELKDDFHEDIDVKSDIYQNMVVKRNEKMANNIVKELKKAVESQKSVFFAIGAGHFFGINNTILDFLRNHGYEMTPILRNNFTNTYFNHNRSRFKSKNPLEFAKVDHQPRYQHEKKMEISMPDDGTLLLDESDELPEFKPKYINFQNNYMTIEEFNSRGMVITDQSLTQKHTQVKSKTESGSYSSEANSNFCLKQFSLFLLVKFIGYFMI